MKRSKWITALAVTAALCAVLIWLFGNAPAAVQPSPELLRAAEGLDEIVITAALDPQKRSLSVQQTLKLTNRTGQNSVLGDGREQLSGQGGQAADDLSIRIHRHELGMGAGESE